MKEGRVLVCYHGEWHSVCADNWSEMEDVVCSTLGYSTELGVSLPPRCRFKLPNFYYACALSFSQN